MYVCICNGITERDVHQAIDQGASSYRELKQNLQVGSCCGKCACFARELLQSRLQGDFASLCVDAAA
ncbi:(2Fe-2S)-binding protein [Nitrincola tapanii]|uniref:Bacterioferritin-associated ferredoxin n=1 Tax=Nitrincola tapanii TaxID=1708751 RepID=A0A5A9W3G6_9GAMM|nr:(2Fe-2S)-binding protein [Nitrincola tapanii]KAA0875034.1 hypothetical protein E1H14_06340 [Nitrincola tapanii]